MTEDATRYTGPNVPWIDAVKTTNRLTVFCDRSLGDNNWAKASHDGIRCFNRMSQQQDMKVILSIVSEEAKANVVVRAVGNKFKHVRSENGQRKENDYQFEQGHMGKTITEFATTTGRAGTQTRVSKATIYLPIEAHNSGSGTVRVPGYPLKLCVVVHELIHACGIIEKRHHTNDDVFATGAQYNLGDQPEQDRMAVFGGREKKIIAGQERMVSVLKELPPVFLNDPTAKRVRDLWT